MAKHATHRAPAACPLPGAKAQNFTLSDTEGHSVALCDLWTKAPLALIFLRHFGCIFCREQLALLKKKHQQFVNAGGQVACVGHGSYRLAKAVKILLDLPFPVLTCGDDLVIYQAWGLGRSSLIQVLGPGVFFRGMGAMLKGYKQGKVVGDEYQMPGAFVIDTNGIVRFAHPGKSVADLAKNDEMIQAIRSLEREIKNG